jgi:hypothetical protein
MLDQMRKLPKIDQNGKTIKGPGPAVTDVTPPAKPRSMISALAEAAELENADLAQLLDSNSFTAEIATLSPADTAGLREAVRAYSPPPSAVGMRSNPAQGASSAGAAPAAGAPKTLMDKLKDRAEQSLAAPPPPGSVE